MQKSGGLYEFSLTLLSFGLCLQDAGKKKYSKGKKKDALSEIGTSHFLIKESLPPLQNLWEYNGTHGTSSCNAPEISAYPKLHKHLRFS